MTEFTEIGGVFLRGALTLFYQGRTVTIKCEKSELFEILYYIKRIHKVVVRLIAT